MPHFQGFADNFHPHSMEHKHLWLQHRLKLLSLPHHPPSCLNFPGELLNHQFNSVYSVMFSSLQLQGLWPSRLLCPWDSLGKDTGVGCHFLSRASSWHRDRFWVSCIVGGFFTNWATREWEKCKSKLQWGITSYWSEWPSFKSWQIINAGKCVEKKESSYTIAGNVNWCSYFREQYRNSSKN